MLRLFLRMFAPRSVLHGVGTFAFFLTIFVGTHLAVSSALGALGALPLKTHIAVAVLTEAPFLILAIALINQQTRMQDKLEVAAKTDALTGLPNRRAFYDRARSIETGRRVVFLLDIDHFKAINDRFGHEAGDQCLTQVAEKIRRVVRDADIVCRFGGEEFAVVMADMPIGSVKAVGQRLATGVHFRASPSVGVDVTASVGAVFWSPSNPVDAALAAADKALYRAKATGRAKAIFYTPSLARPA